MSTISTATSVVSTFLPAGLFPEIVTGGGGDIADYNVNENTRSVASIFAAAVNGRSNISYSIIGGADASKFVINTSTGTLKFVEAPNFEKAGDVGGNNVYDVTVMAFDGVASDTQSLAITVKNINDAPTITSNGAGSSAYVQVAENSSYVTKVVALDEDSGTKITHSIAGGDDAAKFTIDAATGVLKFVAAPDFENARDVGGNNVYDVVVKTTDGALSDTQAIQVKVSDVVEKVAATEPVALAAQVAPAALASGSGVITVGNATELLAALKSAHGGETIQLKAGDYGDLRLSAQSGIPAYSSQVTIKSADLLKPAIFHNVNFSEIDNVKFDSVKFDYNAKIGDSLSNTPFKFVGCSGITVTNTQITGDVARGVSALDDGFGTGRALVFTKSANIEVSNNVISEFFRAAAFGSVTGLKVVGNDISNLSSDGFNFANVDNVVIDSNHIHDFHRNEASSAHPDMIQFWTAGTTSPSTNIVISNNFLDMGGGTSTQSIFMRNELVDQGLAGSGMYYQNVKILNNLIANLHSNGITVGASNGLVIDNNTLIQKIAPLESQGAPAPGIGVSSLSLNVKLTDNVAPVLGAIFANPPAAWLVSNNQVVQSTSPLAANYAGSVYADFLDTTSSSLADYRVVPGSVLDGRGAGSTLTLISKAAGLVGFLHTEDISHGSVLAQSFDATNVFLNGIKLNMTGAKVVWNFGDNTLGTGLTTQHVYTKPGTYEAKATITLADNKVIVVDKTMTVVSDHLLNLNFDHLLADRSLAVNDWTSSKVSFVAGLDGEAIRLNGGYAKYQTDPYFFGNSEFTVLADFKKDAATITKGGTLLYFSKVMSVNIGSEGVQVNISTDNGPVVLSAQKVGLANDKWHNLAVTFSGELGKASLYVDGKLAASVAVKIGSSQLDVTSADFFVGAPAGGSFIGTVDNVHYIRELVTPQEIASAHPAATWESASLSISAASAPIDPVMSTDQLISSISMPNDINLF